MWCISRVAFLLLLKVIKLQCFYWISPAEKGPDVQCSHHWPGRHCGKTEFTTKSLEIRQIATHMQAVWIALFASLLLYYNHQQNCHHHFQLWILLSALMSGPELKLLVQLLAKLPLVVSVVEGKQSERQIEIFIISEKKKNNGEHGES